MLRLSDLLRSTAALLTSGGVDSPRVDAELLAAHVLGVPRGRLLLIDTVTPAQAARLAELARRRADRVPLQHLTGVAPFDDIELQVGPGVFIPRPETELLARWAVEALAGTARPLVVDLCSGTGALALAVAAARPDATVHAVELSELALPWLRRNAAGSVVQVTAGDATAAATLAELDGQVDLVISNPPYVPSTVEVPPEVARHDPASAVFGGADGLDVIRPLVVRTARLLRRGGLLGMEHDDTHTAAVAELLADDFVDVGTHPDLAGRPRYSTARRRWQDGTL